MISKIGAWVRHILFIVRVEGESMWPWLVSGERYLASGWIRPRVGDFAVFRHPADRNKLLVKRVERIETDGFFMDGIVSWSSSSEDFGLVRWELIVGKVYGAHGAGH